jgi:curved DNA-binding protein CbpA
MKQNVLIKNGSLQNFPFVELLRVVNQESLTGAYRITHERIKAVVYFNEGIVVYAASNVRSQRLVDCVNRWQLFSTEKIPLAPEKSTDAEFGETLVANGLITREKLPDLFIRQSQEVLRAALLWTDGDWEFDARVRLAETMRFNIPLEELLLEGARRLPQEIAASRFTDLDEQVSPNNYLNGNIQLLPVEAFVLSRLDTALRVKDLLAISGMSEDTTLHALYSLAMCGLIKRGKWASPFTPSEVSKFREVKTVAKPTPPPQKVIAPQKVEPKPIEPVVDEKKELENFLIRVESARTHYESLGVDTDADENSIKRAYHNQVKRYHPDRFHHESGTPLHSRIQTAFAKVSQAYDILKDPKLRGAYKKRMSSASMQPSQQGSDKERMAEEKYKQAIAAIKENDYEKALPLLGQIVRLVPTQARYHALYGQALAKNQQTRRQAENAFLDAIKLDERNAIYRVMLAEFYKDMKLNKRALSEAQRALSIDPNNKDAQRLLDSLQNP